MKCVRHAVSKKYIRTRLAMPSVLTGLPGEVSLVSNWPLAPAQERRAMSGHPNYTHVTDCVIHFDHIASGGTFNARRVRYNGRNYYIRYSKIAGGKVWIDGALLQDVLKHVTRLYKENE